jgi:hypothetical protein
MTTKAKFEGRLAGYVRRLDQSLETMPDPGYRATYLNGILENWEARRVALATWAARSLGDDSPNPVAEGATVFDVDDTIAAVTRRLRQCEAEARFAAQQGDEFMRQARAM